MKSIKAAIAERKQKQAWLDEIHVRPNVKKLFILKEIIATTDAFLAMAIVAVILYGIITQDLSSMADTLDFLDLETYIILAAQNAYGIAGMTVAIIIKIVLSKLEKKYEEELEVLEELGLREIQRAVEEGTYVPGPTVSLGYRIFRGVRATIAVFVFIPYTLYSIYSIIFPSI
jgi:hypothetical protein